jgi:hypothetical protein
MSDDDRERQLRIRIMELDIERKLQEIRMENRKFTLQAILAAGGLLAAGGGLVAAGAAVFRLVWYRQ